MQLKSFFLLAQLAIPYIFQMISPTKGLTGEEVEPVVVGTLPSVVCLAMFRPENSLSENLFCSGTLITERHILTAGACFDGISLPFQVIVGTDGGDNSVCAYPHWWITFDQWALQRHVQQNTQHNNIAITNVHGLIPSLRPASLTNLSPLSVIEGFHVDLYGCKILPGVAPNMVSTVSTRVLTRDNCQYKISQLEGEAMNVPENYMCTFNSPYVHIEQADRGGPVLFYGGIVGVHVGTYPSMNGQFSTEKINAHIGIDRYRGFIQHLINF